MSLIDEVVAFLEARGLRVAVERVEDGARLDATRAGSELPWALLAGVDEVDHRVAIYTVDALAVPAPTRHEVALLLTRVNYGLTIGNFELDLDDGELRYKTSVDLGGDPPSERILGALLDSNLTAMTTYLDAIHSVALGVTSAEDTAEGLDEGGL
jgi:hypothetical protein